MGFSNFINEKGIILDINEQTYGYIDEASFSVNKLEKLAEFYGKILGKKLGGQFKSLGLEEYTRATGPGKGVRTINNAGAQIRFNYDKKIASYADYELTSIDYWKPVNTDFQRPNTTIIFHSQANVIDILNAVGDALLTGKLSENVNEARSRKEISQWLAAHDIPDYLAGKNRAEDRMKRAVKMGIGDQLEMFLGEPEKNSFEGNLKKVEKQFDDEVYADPDTVFEDIESLLSLVAMKKWRTLIVCGEGGIGKCASPDTEINFKGL